MRDHLDAHLLRMQLLGIRRVPAASRPPSLQTLASEVEACQGCGLSRSRRQAVFGSGSPDADLLFVGEAPGEEEDRQGKPFVGKAGELLTRIIEAMGYRREDVYIANVLKCRPPGNRDPGPHEIERCSGHLWRQIDLIRPRVICALGGFAARTLLGSPDGIGRLRGRIHNLRGVRVMATYHPAYLLRNPPAKRQVWEDVQKIRDFLEAPETGQDPPRKGPGGRT
jgi:DNA polymerase